MTKPKPLDLPVVGLVMMTQSVTSPKREKYDRREAGEEIGRFEWYFGEFGGVC